MKPHESHPAAKYRPEIDGLRAVAVLPVVLFHAGIDGFAGGYVGVDVFFVVSGYLITTIILGDLQRKSFSIRTFYERRARRILPALFVVMLASCIAAWGLLLPAEMQEFSRSLLATLGFVPNIYFWTTTQYFGSLAHETPMLHTWSLGVEEQFYVLFPLVLWWVVRRRPGWLIGSLVAMALLSFLSSELAWRAGKFSAAYFLPLTRAWELMTGAILAALSLQAPIYQRFSDRACTALSAFGGLMLAVAFCTFDSRTPVPGYPALLPIIGTALMIAFAKPGTLVQRGLAAQALVGTGLISYSAYLWHQPIFAFARVATVGGELDTLAYLGLSGFSILLAYITWRFVETPFRHGARVSTRRLVASGLFIATAIAAFSLASEFSSGFERRISASDRALATMADTRLQGDYVTRRFMAAQTAFDGTRGLKVYVIGDSFAQDFVNVLAESGHFGGAQIRTSFIAPRCQIYFGGDDVSEFVDPADRVMCKGARDLGAIKQRAAQADVVILAASWKAWSAQRIGISVAALRLRPDQRLLVVGPKNVGRIRARDLVDLPAASRRTYALAVDRNVLGVDAHLRHVLGADNYIGMQEALCGLGPDCAPFIDESRLKSFDGGHLTRDGAAYVADRLAGHAAFRALIKAASSRRDQLP
jgi:peptidoglycan/LPS O-acetylase OafA/YrhL